MSASTYELAIQQWVAAALPEIPAKSIIIADQGKPAPARPFITIKVLTDNSEGRSWFAITDEVVGENGEVRRIQYNSHEGVVSIQAFADNWHDVLNRLLASMEDEEIIVLNEGNGIAIRDAASPIRNAAEFVDVGIEARGNIDFNYAYMLTIEGQVAPLGEFVLSSDLGVGDTPDYLEFEIDIT